MSAEELKTLQKERRETDEQILEKIKKEGEITVIPPDEIYEVSKDFDYKKLERFGIDEPKLRHFVSLLAGYINMPILVDRFVDSESRDDWKHKMGQKYGSEALKFLDESKLRSNKFSSRIMNISVIEKQVMASNDPNKTKFLPIFSDCAEEAYQVVENYGTKTLEEKEIAVYKLDKLFKTLIARLDAVG